MIKTLVIKLLFVIQVNIQNKGQSCELFVLKVAIQCIVEKCFESKKVELILWGLKLPVVSIDLINASFMPFSYNGVNWVDLLLYICDVIVSQKPYNEE